jgi:hypothetical protein
MSEVANHGIPKDSTAVVATKDLLAKNCPVCREYFSSIDGFLQHTSTIHPYYHPERLDALRSDVMIINDTMNLLGSLEGVYPRLEDLHVSAPYGNRKSTERRQASGPSGIGMRVQCVYR